MLATIEQKLFTPAQIRPIAMKRRRLVMAPLTRSRSNSQGNARPALISFSARPNPNAVAATIRPTGSEGSGKSIPDLHRTIKDVWVSVDKAFVRVEATGMPVRTFLGAQPTAIGTSK